MSGHFEALLATIHTLRAPGGCPWDRKQTLHDAARYLMDEAGELVEATLAGDTDHAREELGDLLFMISFCTEILGETTGTTMHDVAREGNEKLIRRHPHVFGDAEARDTGHSQELWNAIKAEEKRARGLDPAAESALKDMPAATAPLHQAHNYQKDAAKVGFERGPILHGLCTYGHAARHVIRGACGGDPDKLTALEGSFKKPVWPGDTLVTEGWEVEPGKIALQVKVKETGEVVLGSAWALTKA